MSTIFTKIIQGKVPAHTIAQNENYMAFLDAFPLAKGHTLVIPKIQATDELFDLDIKNYLGLMEFAYSIAPAIKQSFNCNRVGVAVVGLEVAHAHVHLVPINTADDLNFTKPKLSISQEELANIASRIQSKF